LLYGGPARFQGRETSSFGHPELDESQGTLFLLTNEYATEGALIAIHLASGQTTLISDHVVGYDVVACPSYRGDLIALKRHLDLLDHPFFLYWLYAPWGAELRLAGGGELDRELGGLRDGSCAVPQPLPVAPALGVDVATGDVVRIDEQVAARQISKRVEAIYPDEARSAHIQGDVRLQVRVGADGTVQDVNLVSGPPQLVDAARVAVRQWRFLPTTLAGHPVPVVTTVTIPFRLPSSDGE
jgi:TonB family protein